MSYTNYKKLSRKSNYNFFVYFFFRYHRIFFGSLIFRGRKLWAFNFFNKIKEQLKKKEKIEPNLVFFFSLVKITPNVLLFPYKIGGKVEGVPLAISWHKKLIFATKWIIKLLRDKYKKLKVDDISEILHLAIYSKGLAIRKKFFFNSLSTINRYLIRYFR